MSLVTVTDTATAQEAGERAAARAPRQLWNDPRLGAGAAIAAVALFAIGSGLLIPRGPIRTGEALVCLGLALGVGVIAGAATGSRWSLLLAPVGYVGLFELTRMGAGGPTVDLPSGTTMVALLAFALGRALHGLVVLVPLAVGARYGIEIASRAGHPSARRLRLGWVPLAVVTVALAGLAVVLARPASTAPIVGADGAPVAGGLAELATVDVGGHGQALMIRGVSSANPVLLHLAGGPGGTDIGAMRLDAGLEQRFVVVTWDQRGTGKSYPSLEPLESLTVEQVVADTIEVTDYLRERFGQERIFLAGQSWGTIPATLAVERHPERYHALVATGQMVSVRETDRIFYRDALAWAEQTGRRELAEQLRSLGLPPYDDMFVGYPLLNDVDREQHAYPEFDGHTEMMATIWAPEYTLIEQVNALRGLADTYTWLYPQLQSLDLRETVTRLDVPVYVVMGEHESPGRVAPARTWFDALDAPAKRWVVLPASGHRANFERPIEYQELLSEVLVDTGQAPDPAEGGG